MIIVSVIVIAEIVSLRKHQKDNARQDAMREKQPASLQAGFLNPKSFIRFQAPGIEMRDKQAIALPDVCRLDEK
jgi:hypothetical protein